MNSLRTLNGQEVIKSGMDFQRSIDDRNKENQANALEGQYVVEREAGGSGDELFQQFAMLDPKGASVLKSVYDSKGAKAAENVANQRGAFLYSIMSAEDPSKAHKMAYEKASDEDKAGMPKEYDESWYRQNLAAIGGPGMDWIKAAEQSQSSRKESGLKQKESSARNALLGEQAKTEKAHQANYMANIKRLESADSSKLGSGGGKGKNALEYLNDFEIKKYDTAENVLKTQMESYNPDPNEIKQAKQTMAEVISVAESRMRKAKGEETPPVQRDRKTASGISWTPITNAP